MVCKADFKKNVANGSIYSRWQNYYEARRRGSIIKRIKPYRGRWCSRKAANRVNDMLCSSQPPQRTELKKEAEDFIEYIKNAYSCDNENMSTEDGSGH